MVCVSLAWVPFRATTWDGAIEIYRAMLTGVSGLVAHRTYVFDGTQLPYLFKVSLDASLSAWVWIAVAACMAWTCPNSWAWMQLFQRRDHGPYRLLANTATVATFGVATFAMVYHANRVTEFIYFNF